MKATFEHQTWAPTELINDNTVTLKWISYLTHENKLLFTQGVVTSIEVVYAPGAGIKM